MDDIGLEHESDSLIKPADSTNWPQESAPELIEILRSDDVWRVLPSETQQRILAILKNPLVLPSDR